MPRLRAGIGGSFEPQRVKMLGEIFDNVWASVAPQFGDQPDDIEGVRTRLAVIVLHLAKDGQLAPEQIERTAARLIREASIEFN